MPTTFQFPKDFLWGTAISSYQNEGNNKNTDWWEWENRPNRESQFPLGKSGIACDSYNRYEEDFNLCQKLNNNSIRLSLEWARINPSENTFDRTEIEHYKKVLRAAKERGLKTFVTLWHFSLPLWVVQLGGWKNRRTASYFEKYAEVCAHEFGDLTDAFLTINEPQVYMLQGYIGATWPPHESDILTALIVQQNLISGHKKSYHAIKKVNKNYKVGIAHNISWFYSEHPRVDFLGFIAAKVLFFFNAHAFLLQIRKELDLIGLNYYFTTRMEGLLRKNLDDLQSDVGWWIYPPGLEQILLRLKMYNLPIYITENGVADQIDRVRKNFIRDMLISCHNAIQQGVDVKGYFYWSLLDNYEWHLGYKVKFGLVWIDREKDLARVPRDSYYYYADICKDGKILK